MAQKTLGTIRRQHTAHDDAVAGFLAECKRKNKPKTVLDYTRLLSTHFAYRRKSLADVSPQSIVQTLNRLHHLPAERRYAFAVGRAFYNWCVAQHLIDRSPMAGMRIPIGSRSRERVLSQEELTAVYRTATTNKSLFHVIVQFLILTGQRRNEIASLKWGLCRSEIETHYATK